METERSSLLPRASPRRVEERDDLGTAAFPFHPQSRSTPMWRKLLIRFFDNRDKTKTVEASDVWPLAHNIRGDQAAAEVTRRIPKSGRMRLLRAVVAANRTEFVQMLLWDLAGIALAGAWPLLVFHLFRDGLMKLPATNERRVFGRESEILWPLVQIFSVEILLSRLSPAARDC